MTTYDDTSRFTSGQLAQGQTSQTVILLGLLDVLEPHWAELSSLLPLFLHESEAGLAEVLAAAK